MFLRMYITRHNRAPYVPTCIPNTSQTITAVHNRLVASQLPLLTRKCDSLRFYISPGDTYYTAHLALVGLKQ